MKHKSDADCVKTSSNFVAEEAATGDRLKKTW